MYTYHKTTKFTVTMGPGCTTIHHAKGHKRTLVEDRRDAFDRAMEVLERMAERAGCDRLFDRGFNGLCDAYVH